MDRRRPETFSKKPKESADCPHCLRNSVSHRETMGHIQCVCPSLERARIAAHHHIWRSLLATLAASSQPTLVPSGTRWTKRTGRPTGDVIENGDFLTRVKEGQGMGSPSQSSARSTQNVPGRRWTCTSSCSSATTKFGAEVPRGSRWTKQC